MLHAEILFRFFKYFGVEFDWDNCVISLNNGGTLLNRVC